MSEPVIEILRPCLHGEMANHAILDGQGEAPRNIVGACPGGQRVRYSRQEAIDLMSEAMASKADDYCAQLADVGVDALLGVSE